MATESPNLCTKCGKTFSQKSSLTRHAKRCILDLPPPTRQKSCRQCAFSKVRCDLKRPTCSRCIAKDIVCEFLKAAPEDEEQCESSPPVETAPPATLRNASLPTPPIELTVHEPRENVQSHRHDSAYNIQTHNVSNVQKGHDVNSWLSTISHQPVEEHYAPQDVHHMGSERREGPLNGDVVMMDEIEPEPDHRYDEPLVNRRRSPLTPGSLTTLRMHALVPMTPTQRGAPGTGRLAKHNTRYVIQVHRSWLLQLAQRETLPPILHHRQLADGIPLELAGSILDSRMWETRTTADQNAFLDRAIVREMEVIAANKELNQKTERELLLLLQQVIFNCIIYMYPTEPVRRDRDIDARLFNVLQDIAYRLACTGLILEAEEHGDVPDWDDWVIVATKRRCLIVVYQMAWSWAINNNVSPCFSCHELGFILAPAPKRLWQAQTREDWETAYKEWRRKWSVRPYKLSELWELPVSPVLDRRTETWLADADEFGMLMMAEVGAADDRETDVFADRDMSRVA